MHVVILGCGRVGARLAGMLDAEGHSVSVIDVNLESFDRLPTKFGGQAVLGEGIDYDVLRQAGIETADAFLALSDNDNSNIMASQIAQRVFQVKRVIVRIYDPERNESFRELGLETLCPTRVSVERIEALLDVG
ncbi:MAG TPA: TrkA family potassium uptake protein [Chloroflexota bacterium]|nr:TrkA family potassium uptake protein [Chloroflexota bacterium]